MMWSCFLLCLGSFSLVLGKSALYIEDAGLANWNITDTALVIYVTVLNRGGNIIKNITVDAHKCCLLPEDLETKDVNCEVFQALGETALSIEPSKTVNYTVIIPTLYPYNRRGECTVEVSYDGVNHIQKTVQIDTQIFKEDNDRTHLPIFVQEMSKHVVPCSHVDKDPFRHCQPVNCQMKYGNKRSYYNANTERCEMAANCENTPDEPKVFSPDKNECKIQEFDMDKKSQRSGLEHEHYTLWEPYDMLSVYPIECVHGKQKDQSCECNPGWRTSTEGHSAFDATEQVFKLCNTQTLDYVEAVQPGKLVYALGLTITMTIIFFVTLVALSCKSSTIKGEYRAPENQEEEVMEPVPHSAEIFALARVHTPHSAMEEGDLTLKIGHIIADMQKTETAGIWQGSCNGRYGRFPIGCVEFYYPKSYWRESCE